jgi:predicted DNA-binding transcriptional regulator AlpA
MPEPTYTTEQLCERYGCNPSTIYRKVKMNGFPAGSKFGRTIVRLQSAVHEWENANLPGLYLSIEEGEPRPLTTEEVYWKQLRALMREDKPKGARRKQQPTG